MVFSAFWMFVSITLTEQELAAVNGWIAAAGRHSTFGNRRARIATKQPPPPPRPPTLFRSLSLCDDDDDDDMSFRAAPAADVASTTSPSSPERRASSSSPPPPLRRGRRGPLRFSSSVTASATAAATAQERQDRAVSASPRRAEALRDPTPFARTLFDDSSGGGGTMNLHPATVRAVTEVLGWRQLTTVQARTWPVVWNGTSAAVRAATGTGKTAAFLVPAIERLYGNHHHPAVSRKEKNRNHSKNNKVRVLIVAPTRELAQQITDEAEKLVTFHYQRQQGQVVMCLTGGTKLQTDLLRLSRKTGGFVPDIVVATPGRLLDHLQSDRRTKGGVPFQQMFAETEVLVLDEADRLVDAFGAEMKRVLSYLPRPEKRQTLLFSATMMHDRIRCRMEPVLRRQLLPADYAEIDCLMSSSRSSTTTTTTTVNDTNHGIVDDSNATLTRSASPSPSQSLSSTAQTTKNNQTMPSGSRVDQSYAVLSGMDSYLPTLVALVAKNLFNREKAMVFLPTAKLVKFVHELFVLGMELDDTNSGGGSRNNRSHGALLAMHSRMSQASRNRISRRFRAVNAGVLLTTDLSARGMDYPDVDLVIQYGAPCNREMYAHRLGRTGRAGREGAGLLVLLPFEKTTSWFLAETKKGGGSEKKELAAAAALRRRDDIMPPLPLHNSCTNNSSSGSSSLIDNSQQEDQYDKMLRHAVQLIRNGHPVLTASAVAAYQSMIAYYLEQPAFSVRRGKKQQQQRRQQQRRQRHRQHRSRSHEELLEYASAFLHSAGVVKIPQLSETLAKKIIIRKQKT